MQNVDFFTAVTFGGQPTQSWLETVDSYFYLAGKKAFVIPGQTQNSSEGTILTYGSPSFLITALKVISYLSIAIPVVMLIAKAILRSRHSFYIIDVKQKIEEGIDISQATAKIQALMPRILKGEEDDGIHWMATGNNLVFSLTDIPNLIFKIAPPGRIVVRSKGHLGSEELTEERFANMIKAKEICLAHKLNHLVIPHAAKFQIDGVSLIAEERLNFNQNESAQEELYKLPGLNKTARELVIFIAKTGFSDVEWRNMPIIDDAPNFQGTRRVALIDLEEMEGASGGIFGGKGRRGLIGCLFNETQIDAALAEARRHGLRSILDTPENVKARRIIEIQSEQQLQQFYTNKGILQNARKPIQVDDLSTLELNLEEQGTIYTLAFLRKTGTGGEDDWGSEEQTITLKDAALKTIAVINDSINKAPENASIKGKRNVDIDFDNGGLYGYKSLGLPKGGWNFTKEEGNQKWIRRILDALRAKGHIFKFEPYGDNFIVQA